MKQNYNRYNSYTLRENNKLQKKKSKRNQF